jgi:hypothetical protein
MYLGTSAQIAPEILSFPSYTQRPPLFVSSDALPPTVFAGKKLIFVDPESVQNNIRVNDTMCVACARSKKKAKTRNPTPPPSLLYSSLSRASLQGHEKTREKTPTRQSCLCSCNASHFLSLPLPSPLSLRPPKIIMTKNKKNIHSTASSSSPS